MDTTREAALLAELGWLQQLARELARDPDVAADAVQDVCTVALQHRGAISHPRAWLATVLRNCLRLRVRSGRAASRREATASRTVNHESTAELVQRAELQHRLGAAVLALPPHHRDVVLLRFFDELPPRVIAQRLGAPVATVHSRLQRALQALREELDRSTGSRLGWVLLIVGRPEIAPATWTLLGALMQMKLSVVAAILLVAGTVTFFWPRNDDGQSDPALALARERGNPRAGGGGSSGGGDGDGGASALERTSLATSSPDSTSPVGEELVAVRGRVLDCAGIAVAGVGIRSSSDAASEPVKTDTLGQFQLQLPSRTASLSVDDERYVTVLGASWTPSTPIEPVLVVAPAIVLAGVVIETTGGPITDADISVQLPDDFHTRLPMRLDRTERTRWQTTSDAAGAFRLPRIPRLEGGVLLVSAPAKQPRAIELPPASDEQLQVVLSPFAYVDGQLDGIVVDVQGAPVAGARVLMGLTSVNSDRDGKFALSLRRVGWPTDLVAVKKGHLPARLEVPARGGSTRSEWPENVVLQLGQPPLSIRGRVLDHEGKPVDGALVWASNPTPLGVVGVVPVQTEYLLAGGDLPARMQRAPVAFVDDPTQDNGVTSQMNNMREASGAWYFVTTGADGSFELPGLLPRAYVLRTLDAATGITADSVATEAGGHTEIRIDRSRLWPVLRGRVVSRAGVGVPGVDVLQCVLTFHTNARVPGGRFEGRAIRHGQRTTTAADGSFELRDVDPEHTFLSIFGDTILPRPVWRDDLVDANNVVIQVLTRCHVEVVLADAGEADQIVARDAEGAIVEISILRSGSHQTRTEMPLHAGRSGVFIVGEQATRLQLLRGEVVVREVPLQLVPGQTTTIQ